MAAAGRRNYKRELQALTDLLGGVMGRAKLASELGVSYGGARDLYEALGYEKELTFAKMYSQYQRHDIAQAIIDRPVRSTWQGSVKLMESDDSESTALEKAWEDLEKEHSLCSKFTRLDKLTGIGRYGVLMLGLNDVTQQEDLLQPVSGNKLKLLYVKPLSEDSAVIDQVEQNPSDPRYGLPVTYKVSVKDLETSQVLDLQIHYSRILHVVDGMLESEVYGTPRLLPVFNRLQDIEKIVGGSAEMFWRGARPGMQGKVDPEFNMSDTEEKKLKGQFEEYEKDLRRILMAKGVDFSALEVQVADPASHFDIQIQCISAQTGIPKRILTGTERGELASTQDTEQWHSLILERRGDFAEAQIVRPFVARMVELGILPEPKEDYSVQWKDLWALSEKERAAVGEIRAKALKAYGASGVGVDALPVAAAPKFILGLDDTEAELIAEMRKEAEKEEEADALLFEKEEAARIKREEVAQKKGAAVVPGEEK